MLSKDNNKKISFSIIMPCYNSESYLESAVESIIRQEYKNWELIAVNDGSTDSTAEILDRYAKNDNRIHVFYKENGGYCSAVNFGLDRVSTDYFMFMGSDDRLDSKLLSNLAIYTAETTPDMIAFRTIRYVDNVNAGVDFYTQFDDTVIGQNCTIKEFESIYPKESMIFSVRDTSRCYKTSVLSNLRYFGKYRFDADGIFSMLFAHQSDSFMCVPVDGYFWTLRKDSLSGKPTTVEVDHDRLCNWIYFNSEILKLEPRCITNTEKNYIESFLSLTRKFGCHIHLSETQYLNTFLRSVKTIKLISKHCNVQLGNKIKDKIIIQTLLSFPKLWMIKKKLLDRR